jgi:Double zinc ribbon
MAETHNCKRCGGDSPADARFCIDCGATLAPAATGDTTRLPGVRCPSCATNNPEHARFCVVCGRGLVARMAPAARPAPQPQPAPQPRPAAAPPRRPHSAQQHSYPRVATPPVAFPMAPPRPAPVYRPQAGGLRGGPLLFLIGLFALLMTGNIWPGILWLIGISSFVGAAMNGRGDKALLALFWWGGLALLFATGTFWPGILLLAFIGMALGGRGRGYGHWW